MKFFVILFCVLFLGFSVYALFSAVKTERNIRKTLNLSLSVKQMNRMEQRVKKECNDNYSVGAGLTAEELSKKLGLLVEYGIDGFADGLVAELIPPRQDDNSCKGIIRINKKYSSDASFSYMHEIMHYILDVGVGNKVSRQYTRMETGKTENFHEQEINYAIVAYLMPLDEILEALNEFDSTEGKRDYKGLIESLCVKYGQNDTTVLRRLHEARKFQEEKLRRSIA